MFYKKTLTVKKGEEKEFEFDMFAYTQNLVDDQTQLKVGQPRKVYNFISADGTLKAGYGFKRLSMPISTQNIDDEREITVRGDEVKTLWKLKWYDKADDINNYYLFYFNDEGNACYDNLFKNRLTTMIIPTSYTSTPYATYYRKNKQDALMLSGEGGNLMVVTGSTIETSQNAPRIISSCSHYGKLFAITADARGTLVYNENPDILTWEDEKTKDLDFGDPRGDLNKIISFNDYLYLFRDFGITRLSQYGKDEMFEISHIYQSDCYIYPNTIAETGDKIYFLEGGKLCVFNGTSIKTIEIDCLKILEGCDNRFAYGECYDGKYYLACRGNFDDGESVGCEGNPNGYKNNLLLVYDTINNHVDIMRGVDINRPLALTNKYKSKLISCFYNQNKGEIGEITTDGKLFGQKMNALWESGKTDFGYNGRIKRIKSFLIKSEGDCKVTFTSERAEKTFVVRGKDYVQKVRANVLGNQFVVKIESDEDERVYISNFVLTVSCG